MFNTPLVFLGSVFVMVSYFIGTQVYLNPYILDGIAGIIMSVALILFCLIGTLMIRLGAK